MKTCPDNRSNCIFCHDKKRYGVNAAGYGNVTAVIDTSCLSNAIYKADRGMATIVARALNEDGNTVLSPQSGILEVQKSDVERAYRHAKQYWESCCQYERSSEVISEGITEVLIESSVPEDAILTFYVPRSN